MNFNSRPLIPVNPNDLDDLDSALSSSGGNEGDDENNGGFSFANVRVSNPEKYLFLPAKSHGSYSYSNMLISLERELNGKNWTDAHKLLAEDKAFMPTIRQFVDFVKSLKSGKALNGKGRPIGKDVSGAVLDDIFKLGNYRGRWLDADFKVGNGKLHMRYGHTIENNQLVYKKQELLLPCLMTDRKSGIDLADWINRANNQGLPPADVKPGDIWYYYKPLADNNSVARFYADSVRAYLDCDRLPSLTYSSLGVHVVRKI